MRSSSSRSVILVRSCSNMPEDNHGFKLCTLKQKRSRTPRLDEVLRYSLLVDNDCEAVLAGKQGVFEPPLKRLVFKGFCARLGALYPQLYPRKLRSVDVLSIQRDRSTLLLGTLVISKTLCHVPFFTLLILLVRRTFL